MREAVKQKSSAVPSELPLEPTAKAPIPGNESAFTLDSTPETGQWHVVNPKGEVEHSFDSPEEASKKIVELNAEGSTKKSDAKVALDHLEKNGSLTKTQLAKKNKWSGTRARAAMDELSSAGIIHQPDPNKPWVRTTTETAAAAPPADAEKGRSDVSIYSGDIFQMSSQQFNDHMAASPGGLTGEAWRIGQSAKSEADVHELKTKQQVMDQRLQEAKQVKDVEGMQNSAFKFQFYREAYEAATGTGSAGEALRKRDPNYKPPFPQGEGHLTQSEHEELKSVADDTGVGYRVEDSASQDPNNPFAKGKGKESDLATIDRSTGEIVINGPQFLKYRGLAKADKRKLVSKSIAMEETVHMVTDPSSAAPYWDSLGKILQWTAHQRYNRGDVRGMSPQMLGYEAINFDFQRLAKETDHQILTADYFDKMTLKSLQILETVVRGIQHVLSKVPINATKGIRDRMLIQKSILNEVQRKLNLLRAQKLGKNKGSTPSAVNRSARAAALLHSEDLRKEADVWEKNGGTKAEADEMRAQADELKQQTFDDSFRPGARRRKESKDQMKLGDLEKLDKFEAMRAAARGGASGSAIEKRANREMFQSAQAAAGQGQLPSARPRRRPESVFQDKFLMDESASQKVAGSEAALKPTGEELPKVPDEERKTAEESGALPRLTGAQLADASDKYITGEFDKIKESIKWGEHVAPKFSEFVDYMKGREPKLQPGQLHEMWQDAIARRLQNATDDEIRSLVRSVLVSKAGKITDEAIQKAKDEGMAGARGQEGKSSKIWLGMADKQLSFDPKELARESSRTAGGQMDFNIVTAKKQELKDARAAAKRRATLIGAIYKRLVVPKIEQADVTRSDITVDDIRFGGGDAASAVQEVAPGSESNIPALTKELLDNSKRSSDDPTTYTKRLTLVQDKAGGKVHLVSTYRRGDEAMLLDPVHPQGHHLPLADMLRRYRVIQSVLLDQPVQKFKKSWETLGEYQKDFGDEARRINDNATSGTGVIGEPSDYVQGQRVTHRTGETEGIPGSGLEEGQEQGHLQGPFKDTMVDSGETAAGKSARTPLTDPEAGALEDHIAKDLGRPPSSAEDVEQSIYGMAVTRPKAIVLSAIRKIARIWQGRFPELGDRELVTKVAQQIYEDKTLGNHIRISQAEAAAKAGEAYRTQEISSPSAKSRRDLKEIANDAADEIDRKRLQLQSVFSRRANRKEIKAEADGADNEAGLIGHSALLSLKLVNRDEFIRSTPLALMASGKIGTNPKTGKQFFFYDKSELEKNIRSAELGGIKAEAIINDKKSSRQEKKYAKKWKDNTDHLLKIALYVRDHWGDKEIKDMAAASKQELFDQLLREHAGGVSTTDFGVSYIPALYEGEMFNLNSVTFGKDPAIGSRFSKKKTFRNFYEAAATGPFIPKSYDMAVVVSHRVRQGMKAVNRNGWGEMVKGMKDEESGMPVAMSPLPKNPRIMVNKETGVEEFVSDGWSPPSPEYELVKLTGSGTPLAVLKPYRPMIDSLWARSGYEGSPLGQGAVYFSSMLKHGVVLIADTFHPSRLFQYAAAMTSSGEYLKSFRKGKSPVGYRGGHSALFYRPEDLDAAVAAGIIHPENAAWARDQALVNWNGTRRLMSNQELLHHLVKSGLNASKIGDAIYKDAVEKIPMVGKFLYHGLDKGGLNVKWLPQYIKNTNLKNFNGWMFDKLLPGLISESAVRNFRRLHQDHPDVETRKLMRDVITDMNTYYGNMGRQGFFSHPTWRDSAQVFMLAPMWQEGLLGKELRFYGRLTGVSNLTGRRGVPQLGALGQGMARGLVAYFVMTQMINLITKGQTTFQNEKHHKMDAWIPTGQDTGVWLSPMSVFAELMHDVLRLSESKGKTWEAIQQIGANKLGPMGRFFSVLMTGRNSSGQDVSTTAGVLKSAASELAPVPISLGKPAQAILHGITDLVPPTEPGAVYRQAFSAAGIKVQAQANIISKMSQDAMKFVRDNGLRPGIPKFTPTDSPSYGKLRHQVLIGDIRGARNTLEQLKQAHGGDVTPVINAMNLWARRPFTGGQETELKWLSDMDQPGRDEYHKAIVARYELVKRFNELILNQK